MIKQTFLIACVFIIVSGIQSNTQATNILLFDADGEIRYAENCIDKGIQANINVFSGNIQNGIYHNNKFYFFDGVLLKYVIADEEIASDIINLNTILPNALPWYMGDINDTRIIFSAYEDAISSNKDLLDVSIYKYEFEKKTIDKLNTDKNITDGYFSTTGQGFYYVDYRGEIHEQKNGQNINYKIYGNAPSISPDGKNLAYIKNGLFSDKIYVYSKKSGLNKKIFKFPTFIKSQPIIRWSSDSRKILVGGK